MSKKSEYQEKKELLDKLYTGIKDIQKQNRKSKYEKIKIAGVRNLKITKHLIAGVALPVLIPASFVLGISCALGAGIPFVRDKFEQKENILKEIDSSGNYRVERHYEDLEQNNELLYCRGWRRNPETGVYQRHVDRYNFKDYTEEDIINVVNSGDLSTITETIGEPFSYVEEKKELTEEEKKSEPFVKVTLYGVDETSSIQIIEESSYDNVKDTTIYLCGFILLAYLPITYGWSKDGYDVIYKIKETIKDSSEEIESKIFTKK